MTPRMLGENGLTRTRGKRLIALAGEDRIVRSGLTYVEEECAMHRRKGAEGD